MKKILSQNLKDLVCVCTNHNLNNLYMKKRLSQNLKDLVCVCTNHNFLKPPKIIYTSSVVHMLTTFFICVFLLFIYNIFICISIIPGVLNA